MARAARSGSRLDVLLLAACVLLALVLRGMPTERREGIARPLRRSIVAPLVSLQHGAELTRAAIDAHDTKMRQRDSTALQELTVTSLESENERLRRLLGLGAAVRWGFIPAEGLSSGAPGEEFTLTLTAGSRQGVKKYSAVVAPEGLVGMVESVDPRTSLAILWSHPDFRVSAMAADGSAFGIVAAHLGGGASRHLLELRGVPTRNELRLGALVVSSGLGSVFPRGIPIGTVIGEQRSPEQQWARTYMLRPAVLPSDVTSVMILLPERGAAGVESVWRARIDSAETARLARDSVAAARARLARQADSAATASPIPRRRRASDTSAVRDTARPATPVAPRRDTAAVPRDTATVPATVPPPPRPDTARPQPPPIPPS